MFHKYKQIFFGEFSFLGPYQIVCFESFLQRRQRCQLLLQ